MEDMSKKLVEVFVDRHGQVKPTQNKAIFNSVHLIISGTKDLLFPNL